jgi:hypothetical protein
MAGANKSPRVGIAFDPEVFDFIRAKALRDRTSFAEQVRRLCNQALEA